MNKNSSNFNLPVAIFQSEVRLLARRENVEILVNIQFILSYVIDVKV